MSVETFVYILIFCVSFFGSLYFYCEKGDLLKSVSIVFISYALMLLMIFI
jgi:hypothetical protein